MNDQPLGDWRLIQQWLQEAADARRAKRSEGLRKRRRLPSPGDRVMMPGGLFGEVTAIHDQYILVTLDNDEPMVCAFHPSAVEVI